MPIKTYEQMSFLTQAAQEKMYGRIVISFTFLIMTFFLISSTMQAQVTFTAFPTDSQLYQRNPSTNRADIPIQGYFTDSGYDIAKVKVYKGDLEYDEQSIPVSNGNRAQSAFSLAISLPAELSNFKVEFYGLKNGVEQLLRTATKVVVGDVILINGQSNAEAGAVAMPQDFDEFSRSYITSWTNTQFTFPGQWGGRLAKNIISEQRIPVAIFNQAVGGKDINYYLPNSGPNSNYNELQQRLQAAGISNVAAIVWFQGEGDGWTTPLDAYKSRFQTLHQGWVRDYQPLFTYIYQIRFLSCGHNQPFPFEAQRQLATEMPKVGIMSSTNVLHDGCHFPYEGGYQDMADNLFQLMRRDIYRYNISDVEAPNISAANQVSDSEILLTFNNTAHLSVIGTPWNDFRIEGSAAMITNGQVEDNQIRLFLSGSTTGITGVSYLAHSGSANDWIVNPNDIGTLTFYNFPIQRTTSTCLLYTSPSPRD